MRFIGSSLSRADGENFPPASLRRAFVRPEDFRPCGLVVDVATRFSAILRRSHAARRDLPPFSPFPLHNGLPRSPIGGFHLAHFPLRILWSDVSSELQDIFDKNPMAPALYPYWHCAETVSNIFKVRKRIQGSRAGLESGGVQAILQFSKIVLFYKHPENTQRHSADFSQQPRP